jgi:hypothetical protein
LSDNFPTQDGLKEGDALSPLLSNFALQYGIRKVQENQVRLKLNWIHQLLYPDNVNLLGDNIDTIKKNKEIATDTSKCCHQNAGQNSNIKIANRSFEHVAQLQYLEVTVTNQNLLRRKLRGD